MTSTSPPNKAEPAAARIAGIAGVILAGGASSRFGSNKALAPWQGKPLIRQVADTLAGVFSERLLVTNDPASYRFLDWPTVGDIYRDAGPLAGIHAALVTIKAEYAMVVACDMPFLSEPLLRFLCSLSGPWEVVLPHLIDGREPLHALYSKRLLPVIEAHLNAGQRKIWRLFDQVAVRQVSQEEILAVVPDLSPFHNINRPEDMAPVKAAAGLPLSLRQAQTLLLHQVAASPPELVPLAEAPGRTAAEHLRATLSVPAFRQSTRDGFALRSRDSRTAGTLAVSLPIQGEIAAGDTSSHRLSPRTVMRIMTGAMVPMGADSVIPFEQVREAGGLVRLTAPVLAGAHIRPPGTDCRKGAILIKDGQLLAPHHLALLASAGVETPAVHRRPRVGFLCTGSELTERPAALKTGQVVSGNRYLLQALIRHYGAEPVDLGMAADQLPALTAAINRARDQGLDLLLTTGGMGPGKYDIVQQALAACGAHILYHSLKVRPGKATLAARLGNVLCFGLPGPPPAVHLLFHELVGSTIRRLLGEKCCIPPNIRAILSEAITVKQGGVQHLKEARLLIGQSRVHARLTRKGETANAILLVPANRKTLRRGETVTLHLLS